MKFWEIDLHQKRTYQCYLPETTPIQNTVFEVIAMSLFFIVTYFAHRKGNLTLPFEFNLRSYLIWAGGSLVILGTKNLYKWQKLERRLFEKHQNSVAKIEKQNAD